MNKGKKITIISIAVLLVAVLLIGGVILLTGSFGERETVLPENMNTAWYDENETEFRITTMEELYGLAELSKTHDFKGQTIKLEADIVINEGDAAKWTDKAPKYLWNPIVGFAGTFDGQGHTISGVYGDSIVTSLGLFTDTQNTCVIRNLNLVNSCFKNNNDMGTGSIIGVGGGRLENIYSDAVLVSSGKYVGGLIGCVKAKGENQITNCWFDGTITMDGYNCANVGGLVGAYTVEDAINTIAHSLSTADIYCMGENVGGICGDVGSGAFLNLSDSMFSGTLEYDTNKYAVVGSVCGQVEGSASIIVDDTYTVDDIANRTIGTSSGYQKGNAIAIGRNYLVGKGGYQWTTLDFDKYWVVQKDDMPRLSYFTQATESIDGVQKMVDIDWYDPTGATFEITTVQQLYGFAYLSRSYDFRGQTIKLGADITVNEGDASGWAKNAPEYNWTPIAWYGSSLSQRFKGTFDGQNHTISGIYAKGTENITCIGLFGEVYHGAVVKNFRLVNSYFEGVQDSSTRGPVGSVAGRLRGTIENVYSDAIIVNSAKNTGGIVGMITGTGQNRISSCWFDGTITGITRTGGILGGVYGNKGNIEATIEHCLNTGDINVEIGQAAVGGICGSAETWSILYMNDCLNAGTYQTVGTDKKASTHIGTLLGTVTMTDGVGSKAVISHSYGVKDFYSKLVGWKFDTKAVSQSSMMYVTSEEVIGYGGYQWTTLDFENHWAVRTNDCPIPVVFADSVPSLAGHVRMVDYSWYDPELSAYTISDFRQLYGMARLWDSTNLFKNKTIYLGADITVNKGNAADWANNAPAFVWEPMKFSGTFNGMGHTISGIYVKGGAEDNYVGFFHRIYKGGTVKNLKLTNSYIEGTMASSKRGAVGSIAGRSNGVIDTVYSDAIVVNSARMTGGLVGMVTGEGENVIRNSWFNGQITGITRTGGILGGMYGNKQDITVTIENCANTGSIAVPIGYGDVGGISGMAETGGTMYISDCLNAGTYTTVGNDKEANTHVGTIIGSVTQTGEVGSHVVLDNVYGVDDFYSKLVGWSYDDAGVTKSAAVMLDKAALTEEGGYRYAQLDYEKAWGLNTENVPVPKAFASKVLDAAAISGMVDYSWYKADSDEYIITTPAQLEGFAILCNAENDYFKGKTVKLGADIKLNEGNAADWADPKNAPANVWTPKNFSGTFDGQGHTISGVYVNSTATYTGLFSTVSKGAVVKNLKLTNSYIEGNGENNRSGVGSIAGRNHGTIDTVYSNAIVKNSKQMTGGIVGMVTAEGDNKIVNCWFDGQITGITRTGGILGGMYGNKQDITATIENCVNTGSISVPIGYGDVGGICGMAETGGTLTISNCLNAGTYQTTGEDKEANTHVGTIIGSVTQTDEASSRVVLKNVYGISEFYSKTVGWNWTENDDAGVTKTAAVMLDKATLTAENGYRYVQLDYANAWGLNTGNVPVPKAFATVTPKAEVINDLVDYSWNTANSDEYIITTPAQLEGFAILCNAENDYFKGKTVKLGADIKLNEGNAADWADPKNAPANVWTPLNFNGTFDGQGHTVSGVYVNSTAAYTGFFSTVSKGATVKNLKLTNSYIEGNGTATRSGVGSIAGRNHGTIDTVYSNAIVKNSKQMTGGIVGMVTGDGENKITNSWFAGQIYSGASTGGILGGTYAANATVEHCLNTGALNISGTGDIKPIGGLVGYAQSTGGVTIQDSLNAGKFVEGAGNISQVGAIIGAVHADATLTINDAYGNDAFSKKTIGYYVEGTVSGNNYAVRNLESIQGYGAYQWMKLDFETTPYWVLKANAIPALSAFDTTADLPMSGVASLADYTWYNDAADEYAIENVAQMKAYYEVRQKEGTAFTDKPVKLTSTKPYVIKTAEELLAFAAVCAENEFAGATVELGADITLNDSDASTWGTTPPATKWPTIHLSGTFDGKGHTISGVYVTTSETGTYTGFFGNVRSGAVVKNLRLENSYIEGTKTSGRAGTGSIAGRVYGTIDSVYSSAIVKNGALMTGGIAGMSEGGTIINCWFDGEIYANGSTGGILGGTYAANATVEHCLNTGKLNVTAGSQVGGLVGYAQGAAKVTISDSLNAGTLTAADGVTQIGTIIGAIHNSATVTMNDAYGIKEFAANTFGYKANGILTGSNYVVRNLEDIQGYGAYQWTTLNFEGEKPHWVLKDTKTPSLSAFDTSDLDLTVAKALPDYTWYDESETTYVLTEPKQLLGFNSLCNADTNYFQGKTVKLGADITLNEGDAADWAENAPANKWAPVTQFNGTFDGDGHTVSGMYVKATTQYTGFFGTVNKGATVKNLKLENSYIEGNGTETRSGVGSIAGRNHGTIANVYSNAIVKNSKQMTGGIAGMVTAAGGENMITNCWFDGEIYAINGTGGILGSSYGHTATIEHCLNTGKLNVTAGSQVGGLIGYAQGAANVTISDSLNAGTLTAASGVKQIGTIIGAIHNNATVTMNDAYGIKEFAANMFGYKVNGILAGENYAVRNLADIQGYGAYQWTTLDFEGETAEDKTYWVLKKDKLPALSAFDTTDTDDLDLAAVKTLPDYTWYLEGAEEYVLTTAQQLEGYVELSTDQALTGTMTLGSDEYTIATPGQLLAFNSLCNADTNYFQGKTVKLGADITLNTGDAADWAENAPANKWAPVTQFNGTFDGNGHTISGMYVKATTQYTGFFGTVNKGAIVKNLKLENSYIEGNGTETRSGVGSIAGRNHGTIANVYSNAILKNSKQMTGGIAGMVTAAGGENMITNCWFDGTIYAINGTGGILGSSYGHTATIEHCLNTGKLNVTAGSQVGGLIGYAQGAANVTISDSLNAGTLTAASSVKQIGTIIGAIHNNATVTMNDAYGIKEFAANMFGYKDKGTLTGENYAVRNLADIQGYGAYQWTTLNFEAVADDTESPYWVLKDGVIPALSAFDTTDTDDLDLEHAKTLPNYSWYNEGAGSFKLDGMDDMLVYYQLRNSEGDAFIDLPVELTGETTTYVLETEEELLAFAAVGAKNDFAGKTVLLGADFDLSAGDATTFAAAPQTNQWLAKDFGGTFDGQGHTISGLTVTAENAGLFTTIKSGATVKNLTITKSSFTGMAASGSVAGINQGTIQNVTVSSDVTVECTEAAGGIAGVGSGTISNCQFAGTVSGANAGGIAGTGSGTISNCQSSGTVNGANAGGILGAANSGAVVEHCMNAGAVTGTANAGGLIGNVAGTVADTVSIADSLSAGAVSGANAGVIVGTNACTLTLTNVYGIRSETVTASIGAQAEGAAVTGSYAARDRDTVKGTDAYLWMNLNFEGDTSKWVLKDGAIPALRAFTTVTDSDPKVSAVAGQPNYSWYGDGTTYTLTTVQQLEGYVAKSKETGFVTKDIVLGSDTYTLSTAAQLLAFNSLCDAETDYFAGKTVLLGADITLNEGSAADWAEKAPTNKWAPISFSGTFNGQGHTISGVYVSTTNTYNGFFNTVNSGAIVQNFELTNSYIEGNGKETRSGVGSIAGRNHGTIDTVYSNAILKNSKQMTGGIVGMVTAKGDNKITNCWFDGTIYAINGTGGILGCSYGQTATIEGCLNTGKLNVTSGTQVGGLVGYVQGAAKVTISDSLNAGTLTAASGVKQIGTIVGAVAKDTLTVSNVYGATDTGFTANKYGWVGSTPVVTENTDEVADVKANFYGNGAAKLSFSAEGVTEYYWIAREGKIPMLRSFEAWAGQLGK